VKASVDWLCARTGLEGAARGALVYLLLRALIVEAPRRAGSAVGEICFITGLLTTAFLAVCFFHAARKKGFNPLIWCISPVLFSVILLPLFCYLPPKRAEAAA
jgi:hypothetical protein